MAEIHLNVDDDCHRGGLKQAAHGRRSHRHGAGGRGLNCVASPAGSTSPTTMNRSVAMPFASRDLGRLHADAMVGEPAAEPPRGAPVDRERPPSPSTVPAGPQRPSPSPVRRAGTGVPARGRRRARSRTPPRRPSPDRRPPPTRTVSEWRAMSASAHVATEADRTLRPSAARTAAVSASKPGRSAATTVRRNVDGSSIGRATARTSPPASGGWQRGEIGGEDRRLFAHHPQRRRRRQQPRQTRQRGSSSAAAGLRSSAAVLRRPVDSCSATCTRTRLSTTSLKAWGWASSQEWPPFSTVPSVPMTVHSASKAVNGSTPSPSLHNTRIGTSRRRSSASSAVRSAFRARVPISRRAHGLPDHVAHDVVADGRHEAVGVPGPEQLLGQLQTHSATPPGRGRRRRAPDRSILPGCPPN